jgi:hypothetical protein
VLRKTPRKSSCVDAEDSTKRKAPDHAKHCLTQAVIALVASSIFVPLSAMVMPGFGVRYSLLDWGSDSYFVPAVRYAMSFAGDPTRRKISEPQIAPTLNIDLPGRWFMTLYPSYDIRINFGDPKLGQTGRLFLPFDALIGAKLTDTLQISLEGSVPIVKAYPVYNFKTEARVRVSF